MYTQRQVDGMICAERLRREEYMVYLVSENNRLKEMNAVQQHLITELSRNGGRVCHGYETVYVTLPPLETAAPDEA